MSAPVQEHVFEISLTLQAPFLTQATSGGMAGLDAVASRRDGRLVLLGSQVKGRLRESWSLFDALAIDGVWRDEGIERLLGGKSRREAMEAAGEDEEAVALGASSLESNEPESNEPNRGRLRLTDFLGPAPAGVETGSESVDRPTEAGPARPAEERLPRPEAAEDGQARFRLRLDPLRGSYVDAMLAQIEVPYAPGRAITFKGAGRLVGREEEAAGVERGLLAGLRAIDSLGAFRGIGFGKVLGVDIARRPIEPGRVSGEEEHQEEPRQEPLDRFSLELTLLDSLLLAQTQPNTNLFQASPILPGGALKGALAASWRELLGKRPSGPIAQGIDPERRELAEHFSKVRFTHGFLTSKRGKAKRPVALPHSLLALGEAEAPFADAALLEGPILLAGLAPAFQVDWKAPVRAAALEALGWATPTYRTQVRSAIDPARGKAADGELFAYRTLEPRDDQFVVADVDLSRVPEGDRAAVAEQLQGLLAMGLRHVGKTAASLDVAVSTEGWMRRSVGPMPAQAPAEAHRKKRKKGRKGKGSPDTRRAEDPVVLALQTPALLADPWLLTEESGVAELKNAYQAAFRAMAAALDPELERKLKLLRWFTRETLAGGGYLHRRFQGDRNYYPYLLTDAGSVFVFKRSDAAERLLKRWEAEGMPLPPWAVERFAGVGPGGEALPGDDWRRCPYLPENGYGEVAVDLRIHWIWKPGRVELFTSLTQEDEEKEES